MENKTSKYFKYAIGEIVLVVIGILIALQINNWNEVRKNKIIEKNYIQLVLQDIQVDSLNLVMLVKNSNEVVEAKNKILAYQESNYIDKPDSILPYFLLAAFNGAVNFVANKGAIEEVKSAGGLSLIKDEKVRRQLLGLYNKYDIFDKNIGKYYIDNSLRLRELIYEKANGNLFRSSQITQNEITERLLKDSDIRNRLINNWALTYNSKLKEIMQFNYETIQICKWYINKNSYD
jgi:hypothetical protein